MITILAEHTSIQFLFAQQNISSYPKDISSSEFSRPETGEEVFQRLREAIAQITALEMNQITITTSFKELFPGNDRRKKMEELKKVSGYSIQLLRPKQWFYYFSAFLLLLSVVGLFINGSYGLLGVLFTLVFFFIGHKTGNEFIYPTVGQAVEKITIDQLIRSDHSAS
jgi:hypothetical protein